MNYIAAFMMLVVELHKSPAGEAAQAAEEDAFWLTYALCRRAIAGYHSVDVSPALPIPLHFCHTCAPAHRSEPLPCPAPQLAGLRTDLHVFNTLTEVKLPTLSAHLSELGFPKIDFIVSRWFLCCYFGVLPAESAVRVMDLFFAATHGGTTLGRDGPTVLMRVGLGLLKWIEPTVMKVTPHDSIQACMSIQEAGADLFSAAHIDMLLYTSFEDIGPLHTVQQMRARLATGTTEGASNGRSAPAKSPSRNFAQAGAPRTRDRSQKSDDV